MLASPKGWAEEEKPTSSKVSRSAHCSSVSPTSFLPRGRNQYGCCLAVSSTRRTLLLDGWKVAVPAARTKLVEGQCVEWITERRETGGVAGVAFGRARGAGGPEAHLLRSASIAVVREDRKTVAGWSAA